MIQITLPWADRRLHPNARVHWAQKAKATKAARSHAGWMTKSKLCGMRMIGAPAWERAKVRVEFSPPDNRRRDLDGMIASHKAAQDGIADALGIDDSKFETTYAISTPIKGGAVTVTIEELKP